MLGLTTRVDRLPAGLVRMIVAGEIDASTVDAFRATLARGGRRP